MALEIKKTTLIGRCAAATGLTQSEVISIARIAPKRYKIYQIDKRSGGKRTICHPSRELKALKYVFLRDILCDVPVHSRATAYRKGSSIRDNAYKRKYGMVILKLVLSYFLNSTRA